MNSLFFVWGKKETLFSDFSSTVSMVGFSFCCFLFLVVNFMSHINTYPFV